MLWCSENNTYADFWTKTIPPVTTGSGPSRLNKNALEFRPPQREGHIPELLLLGGLHHRNVNSR